jgi:hypothetical protein
MSSVERFRQYVSPGPVAAAYTADRTSKVKTIRGPVGSGKTVASIFDGIAAAARVMPVCRDGKIHFRDAVIGNTYGQLERNLYPSWHYWLPRDPDLKDWFEGEWVGGGGRFATHKINFDTVRQGRRVEVCYEAIFAAIGEISLEQFVRGFEPSAWYLFEVDQQPEGIIEAAVGRLGRWPNRDMLPAGAEWAGYVRADLNAPDVDSWYYRLAEEIRPKGFTAYVQPSGFSAKAENLHNLNRGYYQQLAEQNKHKPRWVRRFIENVYGPTQDGEPVYPEYSDEHFYAGEDLVPVAGIPLELGVDAGLGNPAAVIGQALANGQFRVYGEVVPGRMSAKRFAAEVKRELAELSELAGRHLTLAYGWGDPAGFLGADKEDDQLAWCEQVMQALEIPIEPAPSNAITLRLDAVRDELVFEGGIARLLISRRCRKLRKGFASHYCYKVDKATQRVAADAKPHKGEFSHVHDALQYWMLGKKGRYGAIAPERAHEGPGTERRTRRREASAETTVLRSTFLSGR